MRVALHTTIAASRKEPLADLVGRIRQAFLDAGLAEPTIRFRLVDSPVPSRVSSIDRVLKRHPEMERFVVFRSLMPGDAGTTRMLSNYASGETAAYSTLQAIAAGVPRSYPFKSVMLHFHAPAFGEALSGAFPKVGDSLPGLLVTDNWWVTGRQRALTMYSAVEVEDGKKLPPNPEPIAAVIKACGKVRRVEQRPVREPGEGLAPLIPPASADAVKVIVADYRARIKEVVERAALPHTLPAAADARLQNVGVLAGSRKPALVSAFQPMGYGCQGGSGQFHLTRRTAGNLTVELYLDVGTWSHQVSAFLLVQGYGFKASLGIPVTAQDGFHGQYPIGDAAQWQKIVDNLAAMVRELDRSFVTEIEQKAGPSPAWYQPAP